MPDDPTFTSTNIRWARYRESERILEIDFKAKDGSKSSTYEYADVPPDLVAQFNASDSKGRFFALHIRNSFKATKVWPK